MKNQSKRLVYMEQYSTVSQQKGKVDAIFDRIMDEPDINEAILLARSMRGHVAVILKALHSIKRGDKPMEWIRTKERHGQEAKTRTKKT